MAHLTGRRLGTLNEGERLQVCIEEVQYEANVWGNVSRAIDDIVVLANGLRLTREDFHPHFFGEAVRAHADIAQKVRERSGEGAIVTKKIQTLLEDIAEHYRRRAARDRVSIPSPRPVPPPAPQQAPPEWRENFAREFGLPRLEDLERTLKQINERAVELARKLRELSRVANEQIARLEWFLWWMFMPGAAATVRLIREILQIVTEFVSGVLEIAGFVVQQARLTYVMYDDALKWVAMRNKANEVNTWLDGKVLNPERGRPANLREQAWTGRVEAAYAAVIPDQRAAGQSVGLMALVTGGSLMGCFGAQVYVFSVVSSVLFDAIKSTVDLIGKIGSGANLSNWLDWGFGQLITWLKNIKEGGLGILQAEATSKFNEAVLRMLRADNSAFAYRADLQLYSTVAQLPVAWPDPTREGEPWPRERRSPRGERTWEFEVSRDLVPPPVPPSLLAPPQSPRRGGR